MVCHLHRNCLPFLKRVLDDNVVLLKVKDESLCHVYESGYHLLRNGINVVFFRNFFTWFVGQQVVDLVAVDHVDWGLNEHSILNSVVIFARIAITVDLDLGVALKDGLWDAKLVAFCGIYRKNRLRISAKVFDQAWAINLVSDVVSVLYDCEYVLNSPRNYTTFLPNLSMKRVSLSGLGRTKKDNGAILSFHKGLHNRLDASAVEMVLSLSFAEDIVEVKDVCIAAIRGASLSNRQRKHMSEHRKNCAIFTNQIKLTRTCPNVMLPSAVHIWSWHWLGSLKW